MRTGEVVWYVTGRFYSTIPPANEQPKLFDVGYFLHVQGIDGHLFDDAVMSESTALFTFSAEPFTSSTVNNGGLTLGVDMRGGFEVYLRESGGASFDEPRSFAGGKCIGTFERIAVVPTAKIGVGAAQAILTNVFTARLVSSTRFAFRGREYDLRDLIGYGVTQWGTAATEPITPPKQYSSAVPFVGSAVRVMRD